MRFLKRFFNQEIVIASGSILLVAVIVHGIRLNELGLYYDDWYMLWSASSRGAFSLAGLFSTDRPAMGYLYFLTYRAFGEWILGWHLYALAWRCIGAFSFFWTMRILWPRQRLLSTLAAMLFVVSPAFLTQPNALTTVNHLTTYGLALASIALMLAGVQTQNKKVRLSLEIVALIAGSAYVWIYEYMIGLEAMRLALLGLLIYRQGQKSFFSIVKAVARRYWPYVITLSAFLYWRFFIFESTRPATNVEYVFNSYQNGPLVSTIQVLGNTFVDFLSMTVFAWFVKLYQLMAAAELNRIAVAVLMGAVGILVVFMYRGLISRPRAAGSDDQAKIGDAQEPAAAGDECRAERRTALEMATVGLVGTVFAILPVVVFIHSIDLMAAEKSYGLHPSAAAILLVAGGLALLQPRGRLAALLGLLFLSIAANSLNIDHWKTFWQMERSMWWQVTWRAPDLANNTFVMAYAPEGYLFQQDYEVWGPLNLIYRPGRADQPSVESEILDRNTLLEVKNQHVADRYVRDILLLRDYGNLLLISQPALDSCVHVIDGDMPAYSAAERLIVEEAGHYSKINRIQTDGTPPTPPAALFGSEPAHGWCYYYQKAALARQAGDWQAVLALYDTVQKQGLQPADRSEYFPFVEALVNSGETEEAEWLVRELLQEDNAIMASLCSSLKDDPGYPASFQYNYTALHNLFCDK